MIQIKDEKELVGKVISRVASTYNKYFLFFTDETFCILEAGDDASVDLDYQSYNLKVNRQNASELVGLGFISKYAFDNIVREEQDRSEQIQRKREIERLKELKKKYPNEL